MTFEQASGVFKDPMALSVFDEYSSNEGEARWVTLGQANGQHYLVVVHTYLDKSESAVTIRLISARRATKQEIKQYDG